MDIAARSAAGSRTMATPAVVGDVERLVGVASPRSRPPRSRATRCRWRGDAPAKRPNAPSTCTHAPWSCARAIASSNGSNPPECTLPAWSATTGGPPVAGRERTVERRRVQATLARRPRRARVRRGRGTAAPGRPSRAAPVPPARAPPASRRARARPRPSPARLSTASRAAARHGEVRHRAPGDEPDRAPPRQAQQVDHPLLGDVLHGRRCRRHRPQCSVLVPRPTPASRPLEPRGGCRR